MFDKDTLIVKLGGVTKEKLDATIAAMAAFMGDVGEKLAEYREARSVKIEGIKAANALIETLRTYVQEEEERVEKLDTLIQAGETLQANQNEVSLDVDVPAAVLAMLDNYN